MLLLVVPSILPNFATGDPLELIQTLGEPFPTITAILYITLFNYYIILINYYNSWEKTNVD